MPRWTLVVALALSACGGSSSNGAVTAADAARAAMLDVRASGCGPNVGFGTATLIDDTLAVTAAHVVAGADSVSVIDLGGAEHGARVVWFDPDQDVAVLSVDAGVGTPLTLLPDEPADVERGVVAVSRGAFADRVVTTAGVEVPRHVNVATTDIYLERDVVRPGFEIAGEIEPGDSGTMVVGAADAVGIVWSRSTSTDGRAWAVDVPDELRDADFRRSLGAPVDDGRCIR